MVLEEKEDEEEEEKDGEQGSACGKSSLAAGLLLEMIEMLGNVLM